MQSKTCNEYHCKNLRRINHRYYLVTINKRTYVWDFFNSFDFRNYFPFRIFFEFPKKEWLIYDVTGTRPMYKTRESENGMPAMVLLMFLFAPYPFLPIYYTEIGLPVLAVGFAIGYPLIMFVLVGFIKEWQKIDLKGKPAFVLQRTRIEKIKTLHVQKIVYIGLFFFPFLIFLPRLDIWLMFSLFIAFIGNYFSLSLLHPDCSGTCIIIDRYNNGARKELGKMTRKNGDR